jgi:molecular chaperone GrpE
MQENKIDDVFADIEDVTKEMPEETIVDIETDESKILALENNVLEQKDKYLRLMAEFENYKRRTSKERIELIQTAGKDMVVAMLDIVDDVERAEKQFTTTDDFASQKEGIVLIFNKIKTTLQNKGLQPIESILTTFDVEKHEAITEIPAPTPDLVGKVIDEVQKGYTLNDKLIRFAKVVVGK